MHQSVACGASRLIFPPYLNIAYACCLAFFVAVSVFIDDFSGRFRLGSRDDHEGTSRVKGTAMSRRKLPLYMRVLQKSSSICQCTTHDHANCTQHTTRLSVHSCASRCIGRALVLSLESFRSTFTMRYTSRVQYVQINKTKFLPLWRFGGFEKKKILIAKNFCLSLVQFYVIKYDLSYATCNCVQSSDLLMH